VATRHDSAFPTGESEPHGNEDRNAKEEYSGSPGPDAPLLPLDDHELRILRRVGHEWDRVLADPEVWRAALPVDPNVDSYPDAAIRPTLFGQRVPLAGRSGQSSVIEATSAAEAPPSPVGRVAQKIRRVVLGAALSATAIATEQMRKLVALPVLSADALSSVAYGPGAMLSVLVLAGAAGLRYSLPIAAAIAFLMLAVGVSYRQTIRAYPHGGGSYIVASDNLGRVPGLVAAAGLTIDYVMTVAVSIASGVQAIASALPSLRDSTVVIGVGVIALLLAANLRGIRQAGAVFALPTYAFIVGMFAMLTVGLINTAGTGFQATLTPPLSATEGVGVLLLLRAFSSGSTAMTGIEAVSNAVPVFKPVQWRNARTTLTWMIGLLIVMFAGTIALVHLDGVVPNAGETVLSQLAHRSFGSGFMYIYMQGATAAILMLAANTAYNDFPRVLFLLARSRHAPRLFLQIGDRLAFSNGAIALSLAAGAIFVVFAGNTASLIPLYAIGVFMAFTLSQAGMVVHWIRHRNEAHWRKSLLFNATGGLLSAAVFITAAITKFTEGAWVAILAIGLFIVLALGARRHYDFVAAATALSPHAIEPAMHPFTPEVGYGARTANRQAPPGEKWSAVKAECEEDAESEQNPEEVRDLIIVPVEGLDLVTMRTLAYAASLRQPLLALHISPTEEEVERFLNYWDTWGDHLPVEVVVSPHRAIVAPMVNYIWSLHRQRPDLTLTVILPEIVVRHWWQNILHDQTAPRLRRALRPLPKIVVTTVPFHLPSERHHKTG
jgi:amino acid transporter